MKKNILIAIAFLMQVSILYSQSDRKELPILKGTYLGQKPPGKTPELFAKDFISTDEFEFAGTFSANGTEYFFSRRSDNNSSENRIYYTHIEKDVWTKPVLAPFAKDIFEFEPCIAPAGDKLFFGSMRTKPVNDYKGDIWYVNKTKSGWDDVHYLIAPINKGFAMYVSSTKNGTLYYTGATGISRIKYIDGKYSEPELLPDEINSIRPAHPFISPDESFLIFDAQITGRGKPELFISFKKSDGSWTKAQNMGDEINLTKTEMCASVSPNGKYLFFSRMINENRDIYWVDAKIIEELKQLTD